MIYIEEFKIAFTIRKVEEFFLEMFKQGKISGTVHTCVGQEFTGIFASKYSIEGDYIVSNHRGHGHYISFTKDIEGLILELLGSSDGCSKGIGGSQHLRNKYFYSNGIQGGMIPIAAGLALSNKVAKNNKISIAFLGDGTLGEGVLYETLNLSSLWNIPIVYVLEKNNISQSTSISQNFSGEIRDRILGFGTKHYNASIYNLEELDLIFENAFNFARVNCKPVFIEVEVARLNSHSKGDDNRDEDYIKNINDIDPLNIYIKNNYNKIEEWEKEIDQEIKRILDSLLNYSTTQNNFIKNNIENKEYLKVDLGNKSEKRFNELIYNEIEKILSTDNKAMIIGEDIENNNSFHPKEYGGAFKVTRDLSNKYPNQVKNTPISEQAIAGLSIGYALSGNMSILEIMFGDFTTLVFDQLLQHVSKFTLMYGVKIQIPFLLRTPMGGFRGYGPTHSQSIEKHFLGIPGLKVVALNQLVEPIEIFKKILILKEPILLIENKALYTKKLYENLIGGYSLYNYTLMNSFPVIKIIPDEGKASVTIVCYGGIVDEVLKAIEVLFVEDEILVEVFVVSEISNSEITGLADSISRSKKLCFIEEGNSFASYSSEVVTTLIEKGCKNFSLQRISNNSIIPSSRELEIYVLPTSNKIKNIITKFINE